MNASSAHAKGRALHQQRAAEHAVTFVQSGMVVGLGTGTTAHFAVRKLAEQLRTGDLRDIVVISSSQVTEALARELGIPLTTLDARPRIDLTIDGADEVDPDLNLIKGAGGALLREKILAQASAREIIVVDDSKLSPVLGTKRALPVEVVTFAWQSHLRYLETTLGAQVEARRTTNGRIFETDQGNMILDCRLSPMLRLDELSAQIRARAGIVEHGLFLGLTTDLISAGEAGVRHVTRAAPHTRRT
jgi:ribose 5-phosphate isomerase A